MSKLGGVRECLFVLVSEGGAYRGASSDFVVDFNGASTRRAGTIKFFVDRHMQILSDTKIGRLAWRHPWFFFRSSPSWHSSSSPSEAPSTTSAKSL